MNNQKMTGYPSIDKPWLKFYSKEIIEAELPKCTVYNKIYEENKHYVADIAFKYLKNNISYGELFEKIDKCASSLLKLGVCKGDIISLCTAGTPEAVYLMLAANKIGATANFVNPLFTQDQIIERINDTECKLLFVLDELYDSVKDIFELVRVKQIVVISVLESASQAYKILGKLKATKVLYSSKVITWSEFLLVGRTTLIEEFEYEPDYPAIMVYSSGSTGASKGIVLTNDGINATIFNTDCGLFEHKRGDVFLQMVPIWFSTGNVVSMLMPLGHGMTVVLEPQFSVDSFVNDIIEYMPNLTIVPTGIWVHAIKSKRLQKADLSCMKYPLTGGEQTLSDTENEINNFLKEHGCKSTLIKGYGMCELGGTVCNTSVEHSKNGSVGFPIIGKVVVSSFDLITNEENTYGQRGEIRVISPAHMKGYYKNPTATKEYFKMGKDGQLWACTGDIGYIDEDGDVFILGRRTDSYISDDGELIYLFDAENVILQNQYISLCKVVDVEIQGKRVSVAHISIKDGVNEDINSIIENLNIRCKNLLKTCEVPIAYKIRDSFPVHPSGKRDVSALKNDMEGLIMV